MHIKRQCAPYMTNYGSTSEAGSAYPSGKPEFTQVLMAFALLYL